MGRMKAGKELQFEVGTVGRLTRGTVTISTDCPVQMLQHLTSHRHIKVHLSLRS